MNLLHPLEHWERGFESQSRHGCLCEFILCLHCHVSVAALRQAGPPFKESYQLCIGLRNWKSDQGPKGCRTIVEKKTRFSAQTAIVSLIIINKKTADFWDVAPCRSCVNRCFGGMSLAGGYQAQSASHLLTLVPRSRIFLTWRWRRHVPPKRRFTRDLHGAISQKSAFFIITTVKTSNPTSWTSL
jgi:hypothetical protein